MVLVLFSTAYTLYTCIERIVEIEFIVIVTDYVT